MAGQLRGRSVRVERGRAPGRQRRHRPHAHCAHLPHRRRRVSRPSSPGRRCAAGSPTARRCSAGRRSRLMRPPSAVSRRRSWSGRSASTTPVPAATVRARRRSPRHRHHPRLAGAAETFTMTAGIPAFVMVTSGWVTTTDGTRIDAGGWATLQGDISPHQRRRGAGRAARRLDQPGPRAAGNADHHVEHDEHDDRADLERSARHRCPDDCCTGDDDRPRRLDHDDVAEHDDRRHDDHDLAEHHDDVAEHHGRRDDVDVAVDDHDGAVDGRRTGLQPSEGLVHQVGELLVVDGLRARSPGCRTRRGRRRGCRSPAPSPATCGARRSARRPCSRAPPGARPARGRSGSASSTSQHLLGRERVELLDPHDGDGRLALVALGHRIPGDLAAAEHDPLTASGSATPGSSSTSWNEPVVSSSIGERLCFMRKRCFGREDDERRAALAVHLPAQQVEVLRRGRGVADLDVVLGARRAGSARCAPIECSGPWPS